MKPVRHTLFINGTDSVKLPEYVTVLSVEKPSEEEIEIYGYDPDFAQYVVEYDEKDMKDLALFCEIHGFDYFD